MMSNLESFPDDPILDVIEPAPAAVKDIEQKAPPPAVLPPRPGALGRQWDGPCCASSYSSAPRSLHPSFSSGSGLLRIRTPSRLMLRLMLRRMAISLGWARWEALAHSLV